ncbi:Phosphopantetheine attachment site [Teredinibacter turnerae T7901]|uniref:Phosphopantetheine attachment site n=1 Tax=Teredinibacter turnerae (strain ATCC 39867 / T7901) TaxID=377629 RepID=C5BK43_TERTT|nr:acyl carrier protein [Teredinibacter turnerae]ACR14131.1 Phosphopantetheine attachment site [Teredinibacter turnerae T7901]
MEKRAFVSELILERLQGYLENPQITENDKFFEIGADSVIIVRLRQEIEDRCEVDVFIEDFVNGNLISIEDLVSKVVSEMILDKPLPEESSSVFADNDSISI